MDYYWISGVHELQSQCNPFCNLKFSLLRYLCNNCAITFVNHLLKMNNDIPYLDFPNRSLCRLYPSTRFITSISSVCDNVYPRSRSMLGCWSNLFNTIKLISDPDPIIMHVLKLISSFVHMLAYQCILEIWFAYIL